MSRQKRQKVIAAVAALGVVGMLGWVVFHWNPNTGIQSRPLPDITQMKIGDPQLVITAIRDPHPNHEAPFLLSIESMHSHGIISDERVTHLIKLTYQEISIHLRRTVYEPGRVSCYGMNGGTIGRGNALDKLQLIRYKFIDKN